MRLPRFRLRTLMIAVAGVAAVAWAGLAVRDIGEKQRLGLAGFFVGAAVACIYLLWVQNQKR